MSRQLLAKAQQRSQEEEWSVIDELLNRNTTSCRVVLLDWLRGQSALPEMMEEVVRERTEGEDCGRVESRVGWRSSRLVRVAMLLAKEGVGEALPEIERLRTTVKNRVEQLALDVAWATLVPSESARVEEAHLTCPLEDVSTPALAVAQADGREMPLALLVAMARGTEDFTSPVIEFAPENSATSWARAKLADKGVEILQPGRWREAQATPCEARAEALVAAGDYEGAVAVYRELVRDRVNPISEVWARMGTGRTEGAFEVASRLLAEFERGRDGFRVTVAESLVARAVAGCALGFYDSAASDFAAAARFERNEWWLIMEYLCLSMAGHPERTRLDDWEPWQWGDEPRTDFRWPETGLLFLQGKETAENLLAEVGQNGSGGWKRDLSRVHWLLAVQARVAGDTLGESEHLHQVLELAEFVEPIYLLARLRERELRWAAEPL